MNSEINHYQTPKTNSEINFSVESSHTKLGIASFTTTIISGILMLTLFIYAGMIETSTPGGMDEASKEAIFIGFGFFAFIGALIIGFGLGIAGLLQKEKKKTFAILGTTFSALAIIASISLLVIGLTMDKS